MRNEPAPRCRMAGNTSCATRNGPRLAMCWAVSKISMGTCSSNSFSGGKSRPSNNQFSLRGRKRLTGQSLYYPRVMMRTLAQVLTEEYSEHGVHVVNIVIDGLIDSPATRALPRARQNPDAVMNPVKIAEAFYYLHTQDRSCWTHELQLTPFATKPSF